MAPAVAVAVAGAAPGDFEKRRDGIHVLVIPYPARGHNLASLQIARKFLPYGVRVTLGNIFDNLSAELLDVCRTENITVTSLGVRPADHGLANLPFMGDVESVQGETEQLVGSLASGIDSLPVTCIVSDIFLGWTQSVAEKFGIPRYVICASQARILAVLLYTPALAAQGILPVQPSEAAELVQIPGLPPMRRGNLSPSVQASSPVCQRFFAQYVHRNCQPAVEAAAGYFINSFYDLEPSCIDVLRSFPYEREKSKGSSPSFFPVGPLVHDAYLRLLRSEASEGFSFVEPGALYLRWLDKQPVDSVLYVNFGSVVSLSIRQIHELALGLEASKQRFLLVVRRSTVKDDQEEELPLLPERFTAHALETGFVQSEWVNQLDVLSHPAVGGFLTHCGWNSALESVCRGVPLLAWPFQGDQMLNCRFLVDEAKTAVEVRKGENGFVSREEVARAVRELMAEPEGEAVKENVRILRDKVKETVCEDGSVQESVEQFLAELRTSHL